MSSPSKVIPAMHFTYFIISVGCIGILTINPSPILFNNWNQNSWDRSHSSRKIRIPPPIVICTLQHHAEHIGVDRMPDVALSKHLKYDGEFCTGNRLADRCEKETSPVRDGTLVRIVWRRWGDTYCTRKLLFFRVEGMRPDTLMRGGIKMTTSTAWRRDATIA